MVGVEQWAEVRRLRFVRGLSIREISRRTGLHRETIRRAITSDEPPKYSREGRGSKVDPFKAEIARLLGEDCDLPGVRIGELLEPLGWDGGKTILDDYLREVRPLFRAARTTQRTIYRPGEICQFDVWQPKRPVPVGHGQTRPGMGGGRVPGLLARRRGRAGVLQGEARPAGRDPPLPVAARRRCPRRWSGTARPASTPTTVDPRTSSLRSAGSCSVGWHFCRPRDPQAKGAVERLQGFMETNFEPGRVFANERDFQDQLDAWFVKVNARQHRSIRARPVDRLAEELEVMGALPPIAPDTDRRWVLRVGADPYVRFDTCDYSLDPDLVGRRVEIRVTDREVLGDRARHRRARVPARAVLRASIARSPRSSTPGRSSAAAAPTTIGNQRCRSARSIATTR